MMICRNCGREINDNSVFCPHCGTTQALSPEVPRSAAPGGSAPAWEGPEGGGKKNKTGLFIGIGAAVVAVIALVAVFAGGLFSNPKKQVETAFVKSAAAYAAADKSLGLPDTAQWQKDQKITQLMGLQLESVNSGLIGYDLSALNGLRLDLFTSYSGADRIMCADLNAGWGEDELLDLSMKAEGAGLYFNSPQLTGNTHYGLNTETLGADLTNMTGDDSMKDLSFNLFDLVDLVLEQMDQEQMEQDMKAAGKSLWDQAQVKKIGAKTLDLNGVETKTTAYQVTIPEEALDQYVDDLETALSVLNYYDLYEQMFQSMGMPRDEIQNFLDELERMDVYGQLADGLRDVIDELGDLELEVCLSGGYVSGVLYEGEIDDADVSLALYLGGNEEYVDDLSLELKVNSAEITLESSGDHGLKGGVYTDKTSIRLRQLGTNVLKITSDLTLDPSRKEDNFQWKLDADSSGLVVCTLDMTGNVYWSRDQLSLNPIMISVRAVGMEVCTLSFSYHAENHANTAGTVEDPKIITQMNEQELMAMVLDIQSRAEAWAEEMEELFVSRLPAELLYGMMY